MKHEPIQTHSTPPTLRHTVTEFFLCACAFCALPACTRRCLTLSCDSRLRNSQTCSTLAGLKRDYYVFFGSTEFRSGVTLGSSQFSLGELTKHIPEVCYIRWTRQSPTLSRRRMGSTGTHYWWHL